MKDIIFGRTASQENVLNFLNLLFSRVDRALQQKELLKKVPMNAVEDMQEVAHCLIRLDRHPYQRHPSQIQYDDEQPIHEHSLQSRILSHEAIRSQKSQNRNISITLMKRESGAYAKTVSSSHSKRRKADIISKEDRADYSKFSMEIDLGFSPPTDHNEDAIRKKKEEEMNRKMEREEADLKKIMNRKKMDKEMMEALIKDKKQVVFTYDYDGLLLPVTKLEANKLPISHYEMNYVLDSGQPSILKPPETYQPKIHKKGNQLKKVIGIPLHQQKNQNKEHSFEFSEFYKNFEAAQLAPGATLKFKGKQVTSQTPIPNMEFFSYKTKQPQRIQQKHYLEFIKNGNLKRFQMQADDKTKRVKEVDNSESAVYQDSRVSSFFKKTSKYKTGESIIINNSQLLKDLKMLKLIDDNASNISCFTRENPLQFAKKASKFSYVNPIDEFNMSTVMTANKRENTQPDFLQKKTSVENKKTSFAAIQRASTANKIRVRKSIINLNNS